MSTLSEIWKMPWSESADFVNKFFGIGQRQAKGKNIPLWHVKIELLRNRIFSYRYAYVYAEDDREAVEKFLNTQADIDAYLIADSVVEKIAQQAAGEL